MSRILFVVLCLAVCSSLLPEAGAREVEAHWPLMEFAVYKAEPVEGASGSNAKESGTLGTGVGLPQVLVFSNEGALAWRGNPEDLDYSLLSSLASAKGPNEFERLLSTLDRAWTNIPDFRPSERLPSELVETGRPTIVLVVPTLDKGACAPCDTHLLSFEKSVPDWNRIIAALGQSAAF